MSPVLQAIAEFIAYAVALLNGATAVQPPPADQLNIIYHDDKNVAAVVEYEGPRCDTFENEPCYVIVHKDLTVEVGP